MLTMTCGGTHTERQSLFVINAPRHQLILGLPWLRKHDPLLSWLSQRVLSWSPTCTKRCVPMHCSVTALAKPTAQLPSSVSPQYQDLAEVFSKAKAAELHIGLVTVHSTC